MSFSHENQMFDAYTVEQRNIHNGRWDIIKRFHHTHYFVNQPWYIKILPWCDDFKRVRINTSKSEQLAEHCLNFIKKEFSEPYEDSGICIRNEDGVIEWLNGKWITM